MSLFERDNTPFVEIQPETMAIHYWGNSWVKTYEERFREMHRHMLSFEEHMQQDMNKLQEEVLCLREQLERREDTALLHNSPQSQ